MARGKKKIKEAMLAQLEAAGGGADHYMDILEDYMSLWATKNALVKDIKARGVVYQDMSSVGVPMQKNNPSVKELVMVNRQMLSILKELGLKPGVGGGEEDEDEM